MCVDVRVCTRVCGEDECVCRKGMRVCVRKVGVGGYLFSVWLFRFSKALLFRFSRFLKVFDLLKGFVGVVSI